MGERGVDAVYAEKIVFGNPFGTIFLRFSQENDVIAVYVKKVVCEIPLLAKSEVLQEYFFL